MKSLIYRVNAPQISTSCKNQCFSKTRVRLNSMESTAWSDCCSHGTGWQCRWRPWPAGSSGGIWKNCTIPVLYCFHSITLKISIIWNFKRIQKACWRWHVWMAQKWLWRYLMRASLSPGNRCPWWSCEVVAWWGEMNNEDRKERWWKMHLGWCLIHGWWCWCDWQTLDTCPVILQDESSILVKAMAQKKGFEKTKCKVEEKRWFLLGRLLDAHMNIQELAIL